MRSNHNSRPSKNLQAGSFIPEKSGNDGNEKYENISESKYAGFNLLSGPLYASDVESSVKSHDSLDSSSLGPGDGDTWSVQSFEAHDRRDTVWSTELFKPITQSMIDLVIIAKEPFLELVLNILAKCGVFITREKGNAELLMRRLFMSGAFELVADFTGEHPCQVSESHIHTVMMEFLGAHDLVLPAYDYVKNFSLDASEGKALEKLELPSWANTIVPFMKLLKTKPNKILYDLSVKNLVVLSETCQNPRELQFPAFLTMLFAPTKNLRDFIQYDVNSEPCGEIEELCTILARHNMSLQQTAEGVVERFPILQKMFTKSENGTSLDVTVYDLLHGTVSFDLSRIFTFQKKNRYGYDINAGITSFSNEELVKKHGILHSLEYLYYLKECRLTYACAAILASIYANKNKKKIDEFKNKVYGFALSSWPNRAICSACISVLLMTSLEADSLRIVLASAFLIYPRRTAWCMKLTTEKRKGHELLIETEIGSILQQLCILETRAEAAAALLEMLENCIILSVAKISLEKQQKPQNVQLLLQLLGLASGNKIEKVGAEKTVMTETHRTLSYQNVARRERTLSRSTIGSSYSSYSMMSLEEDLGMYTSALIKVASELTVGKKTAERIIMLYKVAASLDLSFIYLVHHRNPVTT
ncbi:Spatacsin-like 1 [Homarus americanus]|uniref:Spatacsin-like 1 n=1 Tax=Homarus americanus TaxID=6706 RepID=A0A8J5JE77_HOMAM|nr:Spatacsin-like 1 [Homarus americanus]